MGMILSNNLTFSTHISTIVSRASSKIGLMFRDFSSRYLNFMVSFFRTHVRPKFSNIIATSGHLILHKILIVQKMFSDDGRFSKRIGGLHDLIRYKDRLQLCKLVSENLELRRLKRSLVLSHRIIYKTIYLNFDDFFSFCSVRM